MRLLGVLTAYVAVSLGLFGGLAAGIVWLMQSEPTVAHEQRRAPIPPRIAESIERKSQPVAPVAVKQPEPVRPVMQEAAVALTSAPAAEPRRVQIRELAAQPAKKKARREVRNRPSPSPPAQEAAPAPVRTVSTGRSDSPY